VMLVYWANDKIQPPEHSIYPRRRTPVGSYRHVPRKLVRMMHCGCRDPRPCDAAMIGTVMISTAITSQPEPTGRDWFGKVATRAQPAEYWRTRLADCGGLCPARCSLALLLQRAPPDS
jgi:hypothetical protein